jgi:hypothetical protein
MALRIEVMDITSPNLLVWALWAMQGARAELYFLSDTLMGFLIPLAIYCHLNHPQVSKFLKRVLFYHHIHFTCLAFIK